MQILRRYLPLTAAAIYSWIFLSVLVKNVVWPVGDQTDVIRAGVAAFPLGLIASFAYPGGRNDAFVVVSACAAINAAAIYLIVRRLTRSVS